MTAEWQPIARQLDERRVEVGRVDTIAGGISRYTVMVPIVDPGEAIWTVPFPFLFTELPVFYSGCMIDPASPLSAGNFPVVSPLVANWTFKVQGGTGVRWYTGCSVIFTATGIPAQKLIFQLHFEARALRGPVTDGS